MIKIYNESCFDTMLDVPCGQFNVILTSPFYNTNKKAGKNRTLENTKTRNGQYDYVRYDEFVDNMTDEQYCDFTERLFNDFDDVLNVDGCVLYNISYGAENPSCMFMAINTICTKTSFTIADCIVWKKKSALPNSCSKNRLTRITEFVFVFCRKNELKTFSCNKRQTSTRETGQPAYENIFNFIEAANNDEKCPYNKATYSSELCEKLLRIYAPKDGWVYDPFMGSGTTAVACKRLGLNCIGSEISKRQVEWAENRLEKETKRGFDYEQISFFDNEIIDK